MRQAVVANIDVQPDIKNNNKNMRERGFLILVSLVLLISLKTFSQNSIDYKGESINYIDNNGLKQGIWKIYSSNDDRAPKGKVYIECKFVDGEINGEISVRKGKKTIMQISPAPNQNRANFIAQKGSKEINGTIVRGKKGPDYFDSEGNQFSKTEKDWLRNHTAIMPMHYGGSIGVQKSIKEIFDSNNIKGEKGRVYVTFTVDSDGNINNPKVAKVKNITPDKDNLLGKEALRIISSLPRMQPAFQGFKLVKLNYTIPINF